MKGKKPKLEMRLRQEGRPEHRQEQRLSPPISHNSEDIEANAKKYVRPEMHFDPELLERLQTAIGSEDSNNPYTDTELQGILSEGNYLTSRRQVAKARSHLGYKSSSARRES